MHYLAVKNVKNVKNVISCYIKKRVSITNFTDAVTYMLETFDKWDPILHGINM